MQKYPSRRGDLASNWLPGEGHRALPQRCEQLSVVVVLHIVSKTPAEVPGGPLYCVRQARDLQWAVKFFCCSHPCFTTMFAKRQQEKCVGGRVIKTGQSPTFPPKFLFMAPIGQ